MEISLIAAVADNGVIGRDNDLPWRLSADLRRFKRLTMGHHLLLGRKTFDSLGRPLPGRKIIVITRGAPELPAGVVRAGSLAEALDAAREAGESEAFVGGGGEIFREALAHADRIYLTRVHARVRGDVVFPALAADWRAVAREFTEADERNQHPTTFEILERQEPGTALVPIEEILHTERPAPGGEPIGRSREGRAIYGHRLGHGPLRLSLIGGCHADEPVGPAMLGQLVAWLAGLPSHHPALAAATWSVVPHANPDGAALNAAWSRATLPIANARGAPDHAYHVGLYLRHAVRESPGDDVEFGFPRDAGDHDARPENRAVAAFLAAGAPYHLHGSFHGMGFAPGPWFLLEEAWADRTVALRDRMRRAVARLGYLLFDVDRGGEKGFRRIDEGFSTRPDSGAMAAHFEARGEPETAALFRPSSMELVRSLGGDPLTLVSEMPLFLVPVSGAVPEVGRDEASRARFRGWLDELAAGRGADEIRAAAEDAGLRPMPIGDQMRLQLGYLAQALAAVTASGATPAPRRRC